MNKNAPLYDVRKIVDLKDMLAQSVELYGDKAAFLIKEKTGEPYSPVSYRQFGNDVNAFGTALLTLELKKERIAIIGKTRYEWYISYMSVVAGVGVVVPIDKELPANEVKNLLSRSHATAVIFSEEHKETLLSLRNELPELKYLIGMDELASNDQVMSFDILLKKGREMVAAGNKSFILATIDPEILGILLFTSGTTSDSKAVMLSHHNICYNLESMCSMLEVVPEDVFLSVLPLHHTYECTCGFLCQIYRGSTVALCEGLRHILKNIQESKPTMILVVPLMVESFYKKIFAPANMKKLKIGLKLSNGLRKVGIDARKKIFKQVHETFGGRLKMLISGGAPIDPKMLKGLQDIGIGCVQGYGLTECAPILALNRDVWYKDESAGLPLPGVDVQIIDKDEDGIGEIIAKGENVMLGYYENEEATKAAIIDGYFHTGDLGYLDADGFVIITGRKKNVIISQNGKNIFPEEIEFLLNRSEYIVESVVYGKTKPDGDVDVNAKIFPDYEKAKAEVGEEPKQIEALIAQEVKKINALLASYKHIRNFEISETEFEKTTSKKIKRNRA
ncbi:MAG: AMP-binding protein [Clostridia bacterium]